MPNLKISELPEATDLTGAEYEEILQGGLNKKALKSLNNPNRGDYNGAANAFPSTGGRFTGGVPMIGDRWRIITTPLTIGGTDVYPVGTIIEAAQNTPGQTTGNWIKYAIQS